MRKMKPLGVIVGVGLLAGIATVAVADEWSDLYLSHPAEYCQKFSNKAAWSGRVVRLGPDWFGVERQGVRVRIHVLEGTAWVQEGRPVRVYPLRRDGRDEIAELRIPDLNFQPVALVRYDASELPRERLLGYEGCVCMSQFVGVGPGLRDGRPIGPPEYLPPALSPKPTPPSLYRPPQRPNQYVPPRPK